jgi:hypothetical protein
MAKGNGFCSTEQSRVRLQAFQLAANLPEDPHLALRILEATYRLIIDGMAADDEASDDAAKVLRLVR